MINSWFVYPKQFSEYIREEDRFLRYLYTPDIPPFLSKSEMAIYESKCTGGSCSKSPYPTYTQPACQCKELLDPVKFSAASSTEKEKMQERYNIKLPYVNTTAEFNTFTVMCP